MTVDYFTFSNVILDDIIFPDGRTSMNTLGGAGLHAAVGMRIWSDRVGYAAAAGRDFDPKHRQALTRLGIDLGGLVIREEFQTPRSWLVMEWDESRTEVQRTTPGDFTRMRVQLDDLPAAYRQARGVHVTWGTVPEARDLIIELRRSNPKMIIVYELSTSNMEEPVEDYPRLLPYLDLFSPNLEEASLLTGQNDPLAMCDTLLDWGASLVALRMAAQGSIVKTKTGQEWRLPAVPAEIVDVTGAGNGYLGGFLTGLGDGLSVIEASLRGVVSASFALEQIGLPGWVEQPAAEAARRLKWARERVKTIG